LPDAGVGEEEQADEAGGEQGGVLEEALHLNGYRNRRSACTQNTTAKAAKGAKTDAKNLI
jgi:hypothetical protein